MGDSLWSAEATHPMVSLGRIPRPRQSWPEVVKTMYARNAPNGRRPFEITSIGCHICPWFIYLVPTNEIVSSRDFTGEAVRCTL